MAYNIHFSKLITIFPTSPTSQNQYARPQIPSTNYLTALTNPPAHQSTSSPSPSSPKGSHSPQTRPFNSLPPINKQPINYINKPSTLSPIHSKECLLAGLQHFLSPIRSASGARLRISCRTGLGSFTFFRLGVRQIRKNIDRCIIY